MLLNVSYTSVKYCQHRKLSYDCNNHKKPSVYGLNSTSDIIKERIGELEDRAEEITQITL